MSRLICTLLVPALAITLASCGSNSDSTSPPAAESPTAPKAAAVVVKPAPAPPAAPAATKSPDLAAPADPKSKAVSHCFNLDTFGTCDEYTTGARVMGHKFLRDDCERKQGTYGVGGCPAVKDKLIGTCRHGGGDGEATLYYRGGGFPHQEAELPKECTDVWRGTWTPNK